MKYITPIKFGILAGLLMIAGYTLLYLIDATLLASFYTLLLYVFPIYFMVFGGITYRKENNGFKNYGEAFLIVLIIAFVASLCIDWFGYLLYKVIDPSLVEIIKQSTIEKSEAIYEKMNLPEDQIEKQLKVLKYTDFTPTLNTQAMRMLGSFGVGVVLSALIALFVKRGDRNNKEIA